jgi:LruC domain-containing protein
VGTEWQAPRENIDITNAYTQFVDFAESNGVSDSLWFQTFDSTKVIPNN